MLVAGREVGAEPVRVGMAFQNPTMLPWLTLRDNVMLPLKIVPPFRKDFRAKRKDRVPRRVLKPCSRRSASEGSGENFRGSFGRHVAARLAVPARSFTTRSC